GSRNRNWSKLVGSSLKNNTMRRTKFYLIAVFCLLLWSCQQEEATQNAVNESQETSAQTPQKYAIALHGGAGTMDKNLMPDSLQQAYKEKLEEAVQAGHQVLENKGSAVEAVQKAINILEDSPLFNAGKGAVLNHREKPELDASIMEGKTL